MDIQRIRSEVVQAATSLRLSRPIRPTMAVSIVKAGMQTSVGKTYFVAIYFPDYPNQMPRVSYTNQTLRPANDSPHVQRRNILFPAPQHVEPRTPRS